MDVGWITEPPLIDEINNIIVLVEDTGTGQAVRNALADTTASKMYGTVSEQIILYHLRQQLDCTKVKSFQLGLAHIVL